MFVLSSPLLLFCSVFSVVTAVNLEDHEHGVDPFDGVLRLLNVTASEFTIGPLQAAAEKFAERLECGGEDHAELCAFPFCLNASELLESVTVGSSGVITEEVFEDICVILLSIATGLNETCHDRVSLNPQAVAALRDSFNQLVSKHSTDQGLTIGGLQELLESLPVMHHEEEDHGDENDVDGHAEEAHTENTEETVHSDDTEHMDSENGHEDDGHVDLYTDLCLGADVIYDQLEVGLDQVLPTEERGHMYMFIVYHIMAGSEISRNCRALPRREFFTASLFKDHGAINGSLSRTDFAELMEELEIGGLHSTEAEAEDDGHGHRRRRSISTDNFRYQESWGNTCYSSEQLLAIYDVDGDVTMDQFAALCPALVQQKLSNACKTQDVADSSTGDQGPTLSQKYGYGTIATFIICVASAIGALFVRCGTQLSRNRLMNLFVGLAVGTLFADAIIHLIPQALGVHGHDEDDAHAHSEEEAITVEPYVWISMVICGGMYLFYLIELVSTLASCCKHSHTLHNLDCSESEPQILDVRLDGSKYLANNNAENPSLSSLDKERSSTHSNTLTCGLAPVAYMVLIGDGVHNFVDGLAIGASFSTSVTVGVSTTIAVLCHEIPHELGDFAILLRSGLSFWKALMFNFLSSLTAMVGFYVGVAISTNEDAERWIVAVIAGMFIYIALVSMLPVMLKESKSGVGYVVLNNVGMVLGFAIMVLLAVFEEKIGV